MDVCVCVYVCGRVCAYVHMNSSWKSVLVIKLLVDNCQPYLLLCSAYLQRPFLRTALERGKKKKKKKCTRLIACLSVSRSVLLHRNWPVEHTGECTLFLLKFHQNSWRSFFFFFFLFFFWSSCELLLGTTTSLFDINPLFHVHPVNKGKIWHLNRQKTRYPAPFCDLTQSFNSVMSWTLSTPTGYP